MGDSEKKILNGEQDFENVTVEDVAARTAKPVKAKKKSDKKESFFSQMKAEFKKIIWPSRQSLLKQTITVLISSACIGVIIAILDFIIRLGLEMIV
ncbi:MAG: preprotein translocase subunit SecE [Butyrivibrio sp.]